MGDSFPYNSPDDCPGCTGFVDRYVAALARATGRKVERTNWSELTGLTLRSVWCQPIQCTQAIHTQAGVDINGCPTHSACVH